MVSVLYSLDKCEVTYSAALIDGTSIFETGSAVFAPVKPIEGWTEVMQLMVEGDKWRVYIPYELAYGPRWGDTLSVLPQSHSTVTSLSESTFLIPLY